jgi:hypothetical protein
VFRKGESAALQEIALESVWVELDSDGKPLVNSGEQYDRQGTINVGDFNFDGHEDFAVQADQTGPYGGPTFSVFLFSPAKGSFVQSEKFGQLTHETLGMFRVDVKKRRLVTFTKSGCCYHVTEELEIVGNRPVAVSRIVEDATGDDVIETQEQLVDGRWRKKTRHLPKKPDSD